MSKLKVVRLSYKDIRGIAVISNLQFNINNLYKNQENLSGKIFKESCLRFSKWNLAYKYMISRVVNPR